MFSCPAVLLIDGNIQREIRVRLLEEISTVNVNDIICCQDLDCNLNLFNMYCNFPNKLQDPEIVTIIVALYQNFVIFISSSAASILVSGRCGCGRSRGCALLQRRLERRLLLLLLNLLQNRSSPVTGCFGKSVRFGVRFGSCRSPPFVLTNDDFDPPLVAQQLAHSTPIVGIAKRTTKRFLMKPPHFFGQRIALPLLHRTPPYEDISWQLHLPSFGSNPHFCFWP